jgi:response regulator NasT
MESHADPLAASPTLHPGDHSVVRWNAAERAAYVPLAETRRPQVLMAVHETASHDQLRRTLVELGHDVVEVAASGADVAAYAARLAPDVVLLDVPALGFAALDAAARLATTMPRVAIVFVVGELADDDPASVDLPEVRALVRAPVAAVISVQSSRAAVDGTMRLAVAHVRELAALRGATTRAREALEQHKLVARACGILMRRTGCHEPEAQQLLDRASVAESVSVVEVARAVLASEPGAAVEGRRQ